MLQTAALLKHVLVLVAGTRTARVSLHATNGCERLSARVWGENGLRKSFGIVCLGADVLNANVSHDDYPVSMLVNSWSLQKLLSSFQSGQDELTIICTPSTSETAGSCMLRTFHDPSVPREIRSSLRTELYFDADSLLLLYEHAGQSPVDVTFNVQDFKSIVYLCCQVGADVRIKLHSPGKPLIVQPRWPVVRVRKDAALDDALEATLVLATLATSQVADCENITSMHCNAGNSEICESLPSNQPGTGFSAQSTENSLGEDHLIHHNVNMHGLIHDGNRDDVAQPVHQTPTNHKRGNILSEDVAPDWDHSSSEPLKESADIDANLQQMRIKQRRIDKPR